MKNSFIKTEAGGLFKNKKLLIAVSAVLFIPILYAGMFLWAFWDPYENLEDIPVAVVNNDEGYHYEGEHLQLGSELVDKLKEEPEFNFNFVDDEVGNKGLRNQDYYILIEIPQNFSKNSTTVMDDKPKKAQLIYKPNESYNFLASQMGETAMLQIEMALEEKITETYAETIFESIADVADGLTDASEATEQLNDGAHELKDGSEKIKENLITLASKTIEFSDGMSEAYDGSSELIDGTAALSAGIAELYDNSEKLYDASKDLHTGANQLATGITDAHNGLNEMNKQVPQLVTGTKQVQHGLNQLHNELPKEISTEIKDVVTHAKKPLRDKLTDAINDKKSELAPTISNRLADDIAAGAATGVVNEANGFFQSAPTTVSKAVAKGVTDKIKETETNKKENLKETIKTVLQNASVPEDVINKVVYEIDQYSPNYDQVELKIQTEIESSLASSLKGVQITEEQQKQLETIIKEKAHPKIEAGVIDALNEVSMNLDGALDQYETVLMEKLDDVTASLEKELTKALNSPIGQLQSGLTTINNGQIALQNGVKQLADGTAQLKDGSHRLVDGQTNYIANMDKFTSSFSEANNGANEILAGTNTLFNGLYLLKDASHQLSDGTDQLADGSIELDDGLSTLVDGTEEFNEEMKDAAETANDVEGTDDTYNMIANPVEVKSEKIHNVPNYGTGFAPYFLSLGLFVGALLLSIVYPLREPEGVPTSGFNWFLGKFVILFVIGIIQALIASIILLVGLGIEVQSVPLFILFAIITSLVFITLIQFLVTCLDDPGRFIAIIILIMQLTTSAGTFPLELIPKVLQPFNYVLPMTYSVEGFKAVISSGQFNVMWQNAGILLSFTIVFMLLTLSYFVVMFKRKFGAISEKESTSS